MSAKLKTAVAALVVAGLALVVVWQVMDNEPENTGLPLTALVAFIFMDLRM